ncbi:hypothetical protein VTN00DRAFT_153 [Thermoascus crustaceus]|uniref:uncharacterized protein n=1 Tax=Thermoascus crustaceus TaxID=5088 RepID=UPI00374417F0
MQAGGRKKNNPEEPFHSPLPCLFLPFSLFSLSLSALRIIPLIGSTVLFACFALAFPRNNISLQFVYQNPTPTIVAVYFSLIFFMIFLLEDQAGRSQEHALRQETEPSRVHPKCKSSRKTHQIKRIHFFSDTEMTRTMLTQCREARRSKQDKTTTPPGLSAAQSKEYVREEIGFTYMIDDANMIRGLSPCGLGNLNQTVETEPGEYDSSPPSNSFPLI